MVLAPPAVLPWQCPRCTGRMYGEGDEAWYLYCGERVFAARLWAEPSVTARPTSDGPRKRGRPRKLRWGVAANEIGTATR
jgi:hypothetical protein